MKKRFLAILGGLISGWLIIGIGETITHSIYQAPEGMDYNDPQALADFISSLPSSAFVSLLIVWILSAFIAGFVCAKISSDNWQRNAIICGGFLLIGHLINAFTIPQPVWLSSISVLIVVPLVYIGARINNQ
ncbi:MAG: hypothetical protein KDD94_02205 [Calditrichaeota bacterium]|nr:hypothetical protein [Calditrichota bacterium]